MASLNQSTEENPQQKLVDVELVNQNTALNVIIGFITLGQQRGCYGIQESAKIWECIKMFQQPTNSVEQSVVQNVEQRSENGLGACDVEEGGGASACASGASACGDGASAEN